MKYFGYIATIIILGYYNRIPYTLQEIIMNLPATLMSRSYISAHDAENWQKKCSAKKISKAFFHVFIAPAQVR